MLKMSHFSEYLWLKSSKLATSGATYPGVPHLGNKYLSEFYRTDKPRSIILTSKLILSLLEKIMLSGFKSL